jgi:hypothetical protein
MDEIMDIKDTLRMYLLHLQRKSDEIDLACHKLRNLVKNQIDSIESQVRILDNAAKFSQTTRTDTPQ